MALYLAYSPELRSPPSIVWSIGKVSRCENDPSCCCGGLLLSLSLSRGDASLSNSRVGSEPRLVVLPPPLPKGGLVWPLWLWRLRTGPALRTRGRDLPAYGCVYN